MTGKCFKQVDVFTDTKFKGNPVAVFFDADELKDDEMQTMARWTNLSETTFVLKPTKEDADYRLRIFTPKNELPFAGHPTIGSCYALLESGLIKPKNGKLIQECSAGLIEIKVEENPSSPQDVTLSFTLPYYHTTSIDTSIQLELEKALGIPSGSSSAIHLPVLLEVGPKWLTIQLSSGSEVTDLTPDYAEVARLSNSYGWTGLEVFGKHSDGTFESRSFAPAIGVDEDPACGSGAGAIGAYLKTTSATDAKTISIKQGCRIGRDAKLQVSITTTSGKSNISVGGQAVTCIVGSY